MQTERTLCLPR